MAVIIGLGNPGQKYAGTRHNIGFELIDLLAERLSCTLTAGKGSFYEAKARHGRNQLTLIKPSTYMNNSGDAVQQALHWFKMKPGECLVCYDDLNLDIGSLRIRPGGSAGGHNGIKDIIQKVGTDSFPRLRIGIGDDFRDGQQVSYVLSPFNKKQREEINISLERAADAALKFAEDGIDETMNLYN